MDIIEFRDYCLSKKGTSEEFPFDNKTLVFKVMGRVFTLCNIDDFKSYNLKCDPEWAIELREEFNGIKPGFHMNKIVWKFNIYPAHSSGFFISQRAQMITGLYDENFTLHSDYDLMYRIICKHKLKGMAMDRDHITGIFNNFGKSSKENKFSYFYEEFKIRKKNN